ncbi:hypothetical protein SPBR_06300 [Sporothrix brasiliensis 5110]|uniref:Uncharacterized protein n=1 Tax=Sporothrix brasiliensis 5110 TaxID=1398154 RepID=A0A0C2F666_9PEZI|nr:uncharacterized protein SPBR_06300 [Sporothrix brasiliensis 5110]KIH94434.1 hypothetical protein SPBR_06300 [Sporothrix brasiliensis 5110]
MCEYEEFLFNCGCSQTRLKSYCHLARNDLNHQCFGVAKLRNVWDQQVDCNSCISKQRPSMSSASSSSSSSVSYGMHSHYNSF